MMPLMRRNHADWANSTAQHGPMPAFAGLMRRPHRGQHSRILAVAAAFLAVCAMVVGPLASFATPAIADQRSDAEARKAEAQKKQAELTSSLEGVSADLGKAYLDLQAAKDAVTAAQKVVDAAEATLADKQRKQQIAADRLASAQSQLDQLAAQTKASQATSADNRASIASLVVSTYQGDNSLTSWTYVLNSGSVEDLTQRASTMEIATGIQESVLAAAEEERAQAANRQARQDATTQRVAQLKTEADTAAQQAQEAATAAQQEKDTLAAKQATAQAATDSLEAKKSDIQAQLTAATKQQEQAQAEIQRIDAENWAAAGQTPGSSAATGSLGSGDIVHPIAGPLIITSPYGYRIHPLTGQRRLHAGVDLAASTGTPQYAAISGTVTSTRDYGNILCGKSVTINGGIIKGRSVQVSYCHLSLQQVSVGQRVTQGQQIGLTGATGGVTGPHCHFEVYINGSTVDPMSLPGF